MAGCSIKFTLQCAFSFGEWGWLPTESELIKKKQSHLIPLSSMASKRNVIKATKSPMGSATCYTTNMTRCVIRPTYKGDATYLPGLQGERRLWKGRRVIETHTETRRWDTEKQFSHKVKSRIWTRVKWQAAVATGVAPRARRSSGCRRCIFPFQPLQVTKNMCKPRWDCVLCTALWSHWVTGKEEIFNNILLSVAVSLRRGTYIFRHIPLHF